MGKDIPFLVITRRTANGTQTRRTANGQPEERLAGLPFSEIEELEEHIKKLKQKG